MEKTLGVGLWAVVALYAAVGVFGVVFHDALPTRSGSPTDTVSAT